MRHNEVSDDPNGGHWAAARSGDGIAVLVQIGEINEERQTRLRLNASSALHLAADLVSGAAQAHDQGSLQIGREDTAWTIWRLKGVTTLTLRDVHGIADPESTVAMTADAMHAMGMAVLTIATELLATRLEPATNQPGN